MHARTQRLNSRRIAALLVLPLLVVLAGCFRMDMDINIESETKASMVMELFDKSGMADVSDLGCEEFAGDITNIDGSEGTVEHLEDDEGNIGCRFSGEFDPSKTAEADFSIVKSGSDLVFTMDSGDTALEDEDIDFTDPMFAAMAPEVTISVTFPGPVSNASADGEIDGNTVTWEGIESISQNLTATGAASGGALSALGGSGGAGSGFPLWPVILLGALLLVVVLAIVLVARRKPKAAGAAGTQQQYAQQQYYAQQAPQQYAQQQYPPQHGGQYPGQQYPQQPEQYYPGQAQQYPGQPQQGHPQQYPGQPQQGHPQQPDQDQWGQGGGQYPQG